MSDDATLRDVTTQVEQSQPQLAAFLDSTETNSADAAASPSQPGAAALPNSSATVQPPRHANIGRDGDSGQDTADKDAAELGRLLMESGYSRDKINDLLAAPSALQSIQHLVRNNPQEFLAMLERVDAEAARNFHEKLANMYVERYQVREAASRRAQPGAPAHLDSELVAELHALRDKVSQAETREQQREQLKAMAAVQARYNSRVDELFDNEDIKKLSLTPAEKKGMRARLDFELARDPAAVQRLNNGNFFDVPRRFKDIIEEWAHDKKSAAEAAKAQRERAARASAFEFPNGPNPMAIDPKSFADSWEQTEEAFAAGLEKFAQ